MQNKVRTAMDVCWNRQVVLEGRNAACRMGTRSGERGGRAAVP